MLKHQLEAISPEPLLLREDQTNTTTCEDGHRSVDKYCTLIVSPVPRSLTKLVFPKAPFAPRNTPVCRRLVEIGPDVKLPTPRRTANMENTRSGSVGSSLQMRDIILLHTALKDKEVIPHTMEKSTRSVDDVPRPHRRRTDKVDAAQDTNIVVRACTRSDSQPVMVRPGTDAAGKSASTQGCSPFMIATSAVPSG